MKSKIITLIYLLIAVNIFAQSGAIDATFGEAGQVFTAIDNSGMANGVAVQSDNKIIAVGTAKFDSGTAFVTVRYNVDGSLDDTFGGTGILITRMAIWSSANCTAIQADGKILTAGKSLNDSGNYDFTVVRHNTDGSIDTSFGNRGFAITDLGNDDEITSLNVLPNNEIIAAGFSKSGDSLFNVALVMYNAQGNLDNTFGNAGVVLTNVHLNAAYAAPLQKPDCKLQPDGKIVVVTTAFYETNNILVLRYNADGSIDNSFGANGQVGVDFAGNQDFGYSAAIQPDGNILAGGVSYNTVTGTGYLAMARLNSDGSMDNTFGASGLVMGISSQAGAPDVRSIIIQSDGSIIAAGSDSSSGDGAIQGFIVAKYQSNGTLNNSFGKGGYTVTAIGNDNSVATGNSIAMQSGGNLVMGGGNGQNFILTRFLNTGDQVVQPTAITSESISDVGLQVYPNPTSSAVTVQYTLTNTENVSMRLWDLNGQLLGTFLDNAAEVPGVQTQQIDLSSLPAGYYMLNIVTPQGQTTVKLAKD